MGLKLGNISIKDMYYGSTKIGSAYLGSSKVYDSTPTSTSPYLLFQFDNSAYRPSIRTDVGTWERVSTSPNVWKYTCDPFVSYGVGDLRYGWARLFSDDAGATGHPITQTCSIIGGGNLNNSDLINLYVAFSGSTGIKSISLLPFSQARDVSGLFRDCTNVESGALAMYNYLSALPNIDSHADTFKNCGSNTQTGLAELQQIPVGWGGLLEPQSTTMEVLINSGNKVIWTLMSNGPDFTTDTGIYVYTSNSISSYAGVSMNRSRLYNRINGFRNNNSYYEYYRLCFVQMPGLPTSSSSHQPTWILTTSGVNGTLPAGYGNTDMPGTLDYNTYGPMDMEYGTYDSTKDVYLAILVTNATPSNWGGLTDGMAFLYNGNYLSDPGFKWFK